MRYALTRLVQLVVVVVAVTFLTTFLMSLFRGGDQAILCSLLGPNCADPARADALSQQLRLDQNVFGRWWGWFLDALTLDFGLSGVSQQPVRSIVASRVPLSLALVIYAQIIALVISIPLGILSAYRQGTAVDKAVNAGAFSLLALPNYVLALLLILIFPFGPLGWFEAVVSDNAHWYSIGELFLPSLALGLGLVAVYTRLLRTDMIATLQEDYIGMAKAKGMPTRHILLRHALRPSSLNLLTTIGLNFGNLIAGTVVVEFLFSIQGLGSELIRAVGARDLPIIQAITALVAVVFVFINILIDLLYSALDPRIRRG